MRQAFLFLVLLGATLGSSLALFAQDDPGENQGQVQAPTENESLDQAARLTFEAGRDAFASGDYEEALERFEQAYRLSPRPILLYNVGLALDRLRRDEDALARFREYLEITEADAPERTQVEARVRSLEESVAREQALQEALRQSEEDARRREEEAQTTPSTEDGGGGGLSPVWVIAAGSAALVAGGVTVWSGLDASSKNDEFESFATGPGATFDRAQQLFDDTTAAETRTNILIGVTAGLAVTAGVLAIFTDWSGSEEEEEAPGPDATPIVAASHDGLVLGAAGVF